jgi:hypothetical protein
MCKKKPRENASAVAVRNEQTHGYNSTPMFLPRVHLSPCRRGSEKTLESRHEIIRFGEHALHSLSPHAFEQSIGFACLAFFAAADLFPAASFLPCHNHAISSSPSRLS